MKVIKEKNVEIFAITDHDNTSAVMEGEALAKKSGLNFIRGVEISSTFESDWEHILAYGIDVDNAPLQQLLMENRNKILEKDNASIKHLKNHGYNVSNHEYMDYINDKRRGGFKLLNYLIDKGICEDVRDFFNRFAEIEEVTNFPEYRSVKEVVEIIKRAGGIPVLAHPFYTNRDYDNINARLNQFVDQGIEGIECYHPSHDLNVSAECIAFCRKNNLIMTVGSDCHGAFVPSRIIGMHSIRVEDIEIGQLKEHII